MVMGAAKTRMRGQFSISGVFVPLVSLGLLFVCWRLGLKWAAIPIIVFLLFYFFFLPRLVRSRLERFHRETIKLITTKRAKEIPQYVRKNIFLQLFGPRGPLDAKLGLAYAHLRDYAQAIPCFENAIQSAGPEERPALQAGLARALLETGDFARAEAEARVLLNQGLRLPELLVIVASARVGLDKVDNVARNHLAEAEKLDPTPDVRQLIDQTRIALNRPKSNRHKSEIDKPSNSAPISDDAVRRKKKRRR